MKKLLWCIPSLLVGAGAFYACSNDEKGLKTEGEVELAFTVDVNDVMTRADWTDATDDGTTAKCPEPDDFVTEVGNNLYTAEFEIKLEGATATTPYTNVKLNKVHKDGKDYVSTGSFSLKKGNHSLERFVIKNTAGEVVYSSVGTGSFYATHVTKTTPQALAWGTDLQSYVKTEVPVEVLCAVEKTPEEFGYSLFTVDAIKAYCVKYMVNICEFPCSYPEVEDNQHKLAKTKAVLTKYHKDGNTWVKGATHEYATPWSATADGKFVGDFCFNDEGKYADGNEKYEIKIYVDYEETDPSNTWDVVFGGEVSLTDLINFENSCYYELPAGNETGFLHFNLCEIPTLQEGAAIPTVNTTSANCWNGFTIEEIHCPCPPQPECKACDDIKTNFTDKNFFTQFDAAAFNNLETDLCTWFINKCADINVKDGKRDFNDIHFGGYYQKAQMITPVIPDNKIVTIVFEVKTDIQNPKASDLFEISDKCNEKAIASMLLEYTQTYKGDKPSCSSTKEITLTLGKAEKCCRYMITNINNCSVEWRKIKSITVADRN